MKSPVIKAFVFLTAVSMLCACKGGVKNDSSLQITKNDVIHLDGTFEDNFLKSWEYILLDDKNTESMMGYIDGVFFDDDLLFVYSGRYTGNQSQIKVFDRQGNFLNDIGRTGRAQNEFLRVSNWAIDTRNNQLILFDNFAQALKRYDYKGNYLGQTKVMPVQITDQYVGSEFIKNLSDGSILYQGGLVVVPTYDYFYINRDGTYQSPLKMTGYRQYCSMDPMEYLRRSGDMGGLTLTAAYSNYRSDTTYLIRTFDHHIYRIDKDSAECVANMAFMPEIPDKVKFDYEYSSNPDEEKYAGHVIPNFFYDMKDYMYIWYYYDNEYLFDKKSSKMYHFNHDTLHVSVPEMGNISVCDNAIVGVASEYYINQALNRLNSRDYDHRYTPELEEFYRKASRHDNAAIVIATYGRKE